VAETCGPRRGPRRAPPSQPSSRASNGARKSTLPGLVASWLDALDETGRWALLKLITGALAHRRVGAPRQDRARRAGGAAKPDEVEEVWHGLSPPYLELFRLDRGQKARRRGGAIPPPFRPPMLSHPLEESDSRSPRPLAISSRNGKWDGIRVQAAAGRLENGRRIARNLHPAPARTSPHTFPDLLEALDFDGAIDGELLVMRDGRVRSFNELQQRPEPQGA